MRPKKFALWISICFARLITTVAACLIAGSAAAAEIPWAKSKIQYTAHRKELKSVLRDFAAAQRIPVEIAPGVQGRVSGRFNTEPQAFLDSLATAYGFDWYFDGTLLTITPSKTMSPEALQLQMGTITDLQQTLGRLNTRERLSAPASTASDTPIQQWEISPADKTLNTTIARWSATIGWQLVWELPHDYSIDARSSLEGTFENAVETVVNSLRNTEVPMKAIFYKGNKVLRIVAKEAQ